MEMVEFKKPRTLADIRNLTFVDSVHTEYSGSEKTYWVYLDTDYKSVKMETSMIHEPTVARLISAINEGICYAPNNRP